MTFLKMCDDKLDVYPAGLAARVSALEEKIAVLSEGAASVNSAFTPVQNVGSPSARHQTHILIFAAHVIACPVGRQN